MTLGVHLPFQTDRLHSTRVGIIATSDGKDEVGQQFREYSRHPPTSKPQSRDTAGQANSPPTLARAATRLVARGPSFLVGGMRLVM